MNEQERSRFIERIVENYGGELGHTHMPEQMKRDPYTQQEWIAEQAIDRAVARDRQQLPIPSAAPSPRLLDALSTMPASSSTVVSFWGSGSFLAGVSLVVVVGIGLLLFPNLLSMLFSSSQDAITTPPSTPPAIVIDSLQVNPAALPVHSESNGGKKREEPQSGATSARTAELEGASGDTTTEAVNRDKESGQSADNQEKKPPIPVVYDNDGTMPLIPK